VGVTAVMHMAVTLSLMPTTGLTLPFVSFGRSSLMVSLASAGILINIGRMRGKGGRRPGGGAARRLGNVGSRMER
jgi:cell division protein FtsW (lipid II flippase)